MAQPRLAFRPREPIGATCVDSLPDTMKAAMPLGLRAREHLGRGSVLGFVLVLTMIVLVLLAIFLPVA
jgi:hypothetical protein